MRLPTSCAHLLHPSDGYTDETSLKVDREVGWRGGGAGPWPPGGPAGPLPPGGAGPRFVKFNQKLTKRIRTHNESPAPTQRAPEMLHRFAGQFLFHLARKIKHEPQEHQGHAPELSDRILHAGTI